jgi:microcystin-dependent protein
VGVGFITLQIPQLGQSDATEEAKIVSDFTALQTAINGGLDVTNLSPTSSIGVANLAAAVQQLMFLPGDVRTTGRPAADTGWLMCDGAAISRATYGALFAAIGTTYGSGDGASTFNLPDLRGRVVVGPDNMGTAAGAAGRLPSSNRSLGQSGGAEQHAHASGTLTAADHIHGIGIATRGTASSPTTGGGEATAYTNHVHSIAGSGGLSVSGATAASVGLAPYQVFNFVIKT